MASYLGPGLVAAAAILAYLPALLGRELFADDVFVQAASGLPFLELWTTGYLGTEQAAGAVHYYRPLLTTSFWLTGTWGPWARGLNVLLHAAGALLLHRCLRSRLKPEAAAAAALFWAVSPMHVEAVASLSGRSEVMAGALMWGAWLALDRGRTLLGCALFTGALLTKETAFFFPVFYFAAGGRRGLAGLAAATAAVLAARLLILPTAVAGGLPYFQSRLTAALTVPRFWLEHYLWPALTGLGTCTDFTRPMIPDEGTRSVAGWLSLLAAAGGAAWLALRRRWEGAFLVFLLPGSHLLMPVDTIGAERWLYMPLASLAVAAARWPRAAAVLCLYLGGVTASRAASFRSAEAFYAEAVSCNPDSPRAWSSWGAAALARGGKEEGRRRLEKALSLAPALATPHYNLALLAYEEGRLEEARARADAARRHGLPNGDTLVLAALIAERQGRPAEARALLGEALAVEPHHALAREHVRRLGR